MAAPVGTNGPSGPAGMIPAEWPAQAADKIVETIGTVREKTTKPVLTAARGLVYGLTAAIVGSVALVVLLILSVRLLANYNPLGHLIWEPLGGIWLIYALFAAVMVGGGLFLLRKANQPGPVDD